MSALVSCFPYLHKVKYYIFIDKKKENNFIRTIDTSKFTLLSGYKLYIAQLNNPLKR